MDYEKKYKEALKIIKDYYDKTIFNSVQNSNEEKNVLEKAFPELKENNEDVIRKTLKELVEATPSKDFYDVTKEQVLSWLEKQKVRGGLTKYEEFTLNRIIEHFEEEGGYDKWIEVLQDIRNIPYQKEQKCEWNEEDEKLLDSILNDLRQGAIPDNDDINWLKFLKERMKGE